MPKKKPPPQKPEGEPPPPTQKLPRVRKKKLSAAEKAKLQCPTCKEFGHEDRSWKECSKHEVKCASCGAWGHSRSTSKSCKFHTQRVKAVLLGTECTETYAIKTGFRHVCTNDAFVDAVNEDVLEVTRLLIETSYFIEFCLRHKNRWLLQKWIESDTAPSLYTFAAHLAADSKPPADATLAAMLAEYRQLRGTDVPWYNTSKRSRLLDQNLATLATNFATNVTTHAQARVRKYLQQMVGKSYDEAKKATEDLFANNTRPENIADALFDWDRLTQGLNFPEIDNEWWKFPDFYQELQKRMVRDHMPAGVAKFEAARANAASYSSKSSRNSKTPANEQRAFKGRQALTSGKVQSASSAVDEASTSSAELPAPETSEPRTQASAKGFVLFTIKSVGAGHIRYATDAVRQLCERVLHLTSGQLQKQLDKILEEKGEEKNTGNISKEIWNMCFKAPPNVAKAFAGSMSTNGVDISWACGRPPRSDQIDVHATKKRETNAGGAVTDHPQDRFVGESKDLKMEDYDRIIGFDPGLKAAFGGTIVKNNQRGKDAEQRVCYRSSEFRYITGEFERAKRRNRVTDEVDKLNAELLQRDFPDLNTKNPDDYVNITNHRLRHFQLCQSIYEKRCITRLSWQKKMHVRKAVDDLVNYWVDGDLKRAKKIEAQTEKKSKKKAPTTRRRKREKIHMGKMKKPKTKKTADKHPKVECGASEMDVGMQDLHDSVGSMSLDSDDSDEDMVEPDATNKSLQASGSRSTGLAEITISTVPKTSTKGGVVRLEPEATIETEKPTTSSFRSTSRGKATTPSKSRKPRRTLIVIGNVRIAGCMRGHVRGPLRLFEKRLLDRALRHQKDLDMIYVDEFRTTVLCSNCNERCVKSHSPHRYLFCQTCRITWNRDVNAGRNIQHLGLHRQALVGEDFRAKYLPKPGQFTRHERLLQS